MTGTVCAAVGAGSGAEPRVAADVVAEYEVVAAVPRIMLLLEAGSEGALWPVRVQVVACEGDLAVLHQAVLVSTMKIDAL